MPHDRLVFRLIYLSGPQTKVKTVAVSANHGHGDAVTRLHLAHCKGANPQRVSTEIIVEIKQLNTGRMALHAFIESVWCSHWEINSVNAGV